MVLAFSSCGQRCMSGGGYNGCVVVHTIQPAHTTRYGKSEEAALRYPSLHYAGASTAFVVKVVGVSEQVLVSSRDDNTKQTLVIDLDKDAHVKAFQGISQMPVLRPIQNTDEEDAHVALVLNSSTLVVYSLRSGEELYRIEKHDLIMDVSYTTDGAVLHRGGANYT